MERRPEIDVEALLAETAWLRGLAKGLVRDANDADDVVQETLAAAVEYLPNQRRDEPRGLRAFLATVARNVVLDRRRADARRVARERLVARREAELDADERAERFEVQRRVVEAVHALDEPYRSAVLMRWFDGLAPRVIAERLGVPVRTVHTRLARALEKLRVRLDREHGGDRRAWMLALARGLELEGASKGGVLVLMSAKAKLAAALLLVLLGAWWAWSAFTKDEHVELASSQADKQVELAGAPQDDRRELEARDVRPVEPRASAIVPTPVPDGPHITIRTVDASNAPMSAVRVTIAHSPVAGSGIPEALVRDDAPTETKLTGADGYAYFEVPRGREHEVLASIGDGIPQRKERLTAGMEHVFRFDAAATMTGRVLWADTLDPIEGVLVACSYDSHGDRYGVRTDANGAYSLAGITFAPAPIYVMPPEGMPLFLNATLAGGTTVEQTFTVKRGNVVRGVVRDARTRKPIASAVIELVSAPRFQRSVTSDADGRYAFPGLGNGGSWTLRAQAVGYGMRDGQSIGTAQEATLDFTLEQERVIRGRVVDAERRALAGLYVAAENTAPRFGLGGACWSIARTQVDGSFELHGNDVRIRQRVVIHGEGRGSKWVELDPADIDRLDFDLGEIVLLPVGAIVGHVLDELGRGLVARVTAELVADGVTSVPEMQFLAGPLAREAKTDDEGAFTFADLPPGRHVLRVDITDRIGPRPLLVDVNSGETKDVDVRMHAPLSIRGVVLDPEGRALGGARVAVLSATMSLRLAPRATSASDGSFELEGMQPGAYLVLASTTSSRDDPEGPLTSGAYAHGVEAGTSDLVLRLPRRIHAWCRVVDASNRPIAGAGVTVSRADGYASFGTSTSSDGYARLPTAQHELHRIVVKRPVPPSEDPRVAVDVPVALELETELDAYADKEHPLELRIPDPPR